MYRFILAMLLAIMPATLCAQTAPPDVPTPVNPAPTYKSGTTPNAIGDGSNARGGVMPIIASQLADIPTPSGLRTAWTSTASTGFCDVAGFPATTGATCSGAPESKFRTEIGGFTHASYDDPERVYGQPGASHLHCFFGNPSTNAYSTYASLRNRANEFSASGKIGSSASGGPLNGSAYWVPCLIKVNPFGNGKNYIVRSDGETVYYVSNPDGVFSRIPRGTRYVTGYNMDSPDGAFYAAEIAAANAQTGTTGRYQCNAAGNSTDCLTRNGFTGWKCVNGSSDVAGADGGTNYPSITTSSGADRWGGTCTDGMKLVATLNAPICYSGQALWVPGAYNHFRQPVYDGIAGGGICPTGWFHVPALSLQIGYPHHGPSDYTTWRLSSDDMAAATAGHSVPNGTSMHADWMGAWDDQTMYGNGTVQGWLQFCTGVDGAQPHECNGSTFTGGSTGNARLVGGLGDTTPDGQNKVHDSTVTTANPAGMFVVPTTSKGPVTINAVPR